MINTQLNNFGLGQIIKNKKPDWSTKITFEIETYLELRNELSKFVWKLSNELNEFNCNKLTDLIEIN